MLLVSVSLTGIASGLPLLESSEEVGFDSGETLSRTSTKSRGRSRARTLKSSRAFSDSVESTSNAERGVQLSPEEALNWGLAIVEAAIIKRVLETEDNDVGITFDQINVLQSEFGVRTGRSRSYSLFGNAEVKTQRKNINSLVSPTFHQSSDCNRTKNKPIRNRTKLNQSYHNYNPASLEPCVAPTSTKNAIFRQKRRRFYFFE